MPGKEFSDCFDTTNNPYKLTSLFMKASVHEGLSHCWFCQSVDHGGV